MRVTQALDVAAASVAAEGQGNTPLDVIEQAIRSAFEKGDASNQAFREKVYRQAFAALDRVLQANSGVTVETAMRRRKALQAKIVEIEQEFLPGRARPAPPPPEPAPEPILSEAQVSEAPEVDRDDVPPPVDVEVKRDQPEVRVEAPKTSKPVRVEPVVAEEGDLTHPVVTPERIRLRADADKPEPRSRRRISRFASFFVAASLFSLIAMGIWWGIQTGLIGRGDQTEPVAVVPADPEDFEPGADEPPVQSSQAPAGRPWIAVFEPGDIDAMSAPADATAEIIKGDNGDFVRITSGDSGSAILFDVGQGVLEQIAGKNVTFDIVAKAEDGEDTQMSVLCNFGELGDCGRKRYLVGNARSDYLFDIQMPNKKPGAGGTIAINSDFDKAGKSVDIYEIRVSIEQ